jgi:hypothetical protein
VVDPKDVGKTLPLSGDAGDARGFEKTRDAASPDAMPPKPPQPPPTMVLPPQPAVNPFAATQQVNPFAPAPPPAPVNPFAPPPPPPAPVNPFAAAPPPPAPVNPFAVSPAQPAQGPYRDPGAVAPQPAAPVAAAQPFQQLAPIASLRPLTILVAIAAAIHGMSLLYAAQAIASVKVATTLGEASAIYKTAGTSEQLTLIGIAALALALVPWLAVANRNARKLCADKLRYSAVAAALSFAVPVLNIVVIGNVLVDLSRHSHERTEPAHRIVRMFAKAMIVITALRFVLMLVASSGVNKIGVGDLMFYPCGFGDPFRFLMVTGPSYQGPLSLLVFASLAIPVLGVMACFAIEREQVETQRRLRAKVM